MLWLANCCFAPPSSEHWRRRLEWDVDSEQLESENFVDFPCKRPAKHFSIFHHLLCKQGAGGSSPPTSTIIAGVRPLNHFNQMPSEFSPVTTCYSGRGRGFERPHGHQLNSRSHIDLRCFFLGTFLPQSRDNRYNRSKNKRQQGLMQKNICATRIDPAFRLRVARPPHNFRIARDPLRMTESRQLW